EGPSTRLWITHAQLRDQGSSVRSLAWARDDSYLARDRLEDVPDSFGKNLLTGSVWMNSIGDIQRGIACDTLQEIWHECSSVFGSEIGKHPVKCGNVIVGRIIGQLHSGDHDTHVWISCLHLINNLLKIVSNLIDRHSSESIVDSELQNEDINLAFQVSREPLQTALRGAPGCAGVGDLKFQACSEQLLIGFAWSESETLREAVAQDENRFRRAGIDGLNRCDRPGNAKQCEASSHKETLDA